MNIKKEIEKIINTLKIDWLRVEYKSSLTDKEYFGIKYLEYILDKYYDCEFEYLDLDDNYLECTIEEKGVYYDITFEYLGNSVHLFKAHRVINGEWQRNGIEQVVLTTDTLNKLSSIVA